ncbi:hydrogen peroxide-inducible genes activator [Thiolapillus brandeum]|uniref:LysR family transcriptional regulator n=1 Tax=Thiolapillus brandeum TaxID=1076588 RepID=A0A7U6GK92_9GAMM|nr:hydrogen peroxide-inducible genes activator [Thiolapillus brandeum]BAO45139.1 LysR family transcriptional regulator [Thiolapillus brandeum]
MTLNELKYIVAVARARHFGRAAEACFISQPTLSVAVRKLERELGVELFERRQGEVTVTPVGEQVVTQAQRVLEEAGVIREIVEHGRDQLAAPLRIGAIYTIGPYLFPHLISELAQRAPQMPLVIEENYTHVLAEKLKQGEVDAILISLPFEEHGILTVPLYEEHFVALVPGSHPLNQRDRLSIEDISQEKVLLLGTGHCFRDQVLEICPDCLRKRNLAEGDMLADLEGSSLETIRYMVASGMGVTILPCSAAGADRFSQRLVSIKRFQDADPSRVVALAWRKSFPRPQAIDVLRQAVHASKLSCIKHLD